MTEEEWKIEFKDFEQFAIDKELYYQLIILLSIYFFTKTVILFTLSLLKTRDND